MYHFLNISKPFSPGKSYRFFVEWDFPQKVNTAPTQTFNLKLFGITYSRPYLTKPQYLKTTDRTPLWDRFFFLRFWTFFKLSFWNLFSILEFSCKPNFFRLQNHWMRASDSSRLIFRIKSDTDIVERRLIVQNFSIDQYFPTNI